MTVKIFCTSDLIVIVHIQGHFLYNMHFEILYIYLSLPNFLYESFLIFSQTSNEVHFLHLDGVNIIINAIKNQLNNLIVWQYIFQPLITLYPFAIAILDLNQH